MFLLGNINYEAREILQLIKIYKDIITLNLDGKTLNGFDGGHTKGFSGFHTKTCTVSRAFDLVTVEPTFT